MSRRANMLVVGQANTPIYVYLEDRRPDGTSAAITNPAATVTADVINTDGTAGDTITLDPSDNEDVPIAEGYWQYIAPEGFEGEDTGTMYWHMFYEIGGARTPSPELIAIPVRKVRTGS